VLYEFWFILSFTNTDPMTEGGKSGPPNRAPMSGKASYLWEVTWYPRVCHSQQTHPLPFILQTWHSHCRIGDCFCKFTSLDPLCSAQTGSPLIGCGSSPHTDSLGWRRLYIHIYHPWKIASSLPQAGSVTLQQHSDLGVAWPTPLDPSH
jgi:hypothetical protein